MFRMPSIKCPFHPQNPGLTTLVSFLLRLVCVSYHSRLMFNASQQKVSFSEGCEITLPKPVVRATSPKKVDIASEEALFSTPERKHIYAAFTFTSPSPSSKRFANPHLDIFGDFRF